MWTSLYIITLSRHCWRFPIEREIDNLIKKRRATCRSKGQKKNFFSSSAGNVQSLPSKDKHLNNRCPLPPPFSQFLLLHGMEQPFGKFMSAFLAISLPKVFPIPASWPFGDRGRRAAETALMLCKCSSAVAKALVCYQHCSSQKNKAQEDESCCEEI